MSKITNDGLTRSCTRYFIAVYPYDNSGRQRVKICPALRSGPAKNASIQTKMSLATAGIYCTINPPLSGAVEDCSIVRVRQLQMLYRRKCCMSASQRMFGSLWNVVVAHEHRRQDGSCRLGTRAKCQTATDVRAWQPWSRRSGVPVASVADGAPALCGLNVEYQSPDGRRRSEPTATGSSVLPRCRRTESCSSPGDRKRMPGPMFTRISKQPP